jgi:hypothetical protein
VTLDELKHDPPRPWHPRIDGDKYGRQIDGWGDRADERSVLARIWYPNGRIVELRPLAFTVSLAVVSPDYRYSYNDGWCYKSAQLAFLAAIAWDGGEDTEPEGWHRHPPSGRRRPDGDAAAEYVNP